MRTSATWPTVKPHHSARRTTNTAKPMVVSALEGSEYDGEHKKYAIWEYTTTKGEQQRPDCGVAPQTRGQTQTHQGREGPVVAAVLEQVGQRHRGAAEPVHEERLEQALRVVRDVAADTEPDTNVRETVSYGLGSLGVVSTHTATLLSTHLAA